MHDGKSTRSSNASPSIGGPRPRPSRKVFFAVRMFAITCGAFVSSRRWLFGALLITAVLLTLISVVRPTPHRALRAGDEPDIQFDEVKTYSLASRSGELRFRPEVGGNAPSFDADAKAAARSPKLPSDALAWEDGHRAGQPLPLSRRLDAVRSRRARGAWLTGTIEGIGDTPGPNEVEQQAHGQTQGPALR